MSDWSSRPHRQTGRTPTPLVRKIVPTLETAPGAGRDGRPAGDGVLNDLRGAGPRPAQPALPHRPDHWRTGPALRASLPRVVAGRGWQETGQLPDGGGWRYVGRQQGKKNRAPPKTRHETATTTPWSGPRSCTPSWMATPASPPPRFTTTRGRPPPFGVLRRAVAWFAARGVHIERVLSDNGSADRSRLWRDTCAELGVTPKTDTHTGDRPTARSNASTPPWPTGGQSNGPTPMNANASDQRLCQP